MTGPVSPHETDPFAVRAATARTAFIRVAVIVGLPR